MHGRVPLAVSKVGARLAVLQELSNAGQVPALTGQVEGRLPGPVPAVDLAEGGGEGVTQGLGFA